MWTPTSKAKIIAPLNCIADECPSARNCRRICSVDRRASSTDDLCTRARATTLLQYLDVDAQGRPESVTYEALHALKQLLNADDSI